MKKLIWIVMILLMVTVGTAITLSNKQAALNYVHAQKTTINTDITQAMTTIKYTTDKECIIKFDTEDIRCMVCYQYMYKGQQYDECIGLADGTTEQQDTKTVYNLVMREILRMATPEEVKYIEKELKDKTLMIK